ncbi:hypothetical protein LWI29_031739 [Acer saccharum]|uniref:Glutaredoxin domain-containing protein n=1 Tax=Acer saccharum TaxID=4024 RepID=A0AA39RXH6_ACESA|nr:hypothetical protein LWI29_031739 [Acer saccharum]KAK1556209.1 hypothetical protein Q3G72_000693 [Acer saccharum]
MQVAKKSSSTAGIRMSNAMAINSDSSSLATAMKLESTYEMVSKLASSNAVVLFSVSGCCMCTVAKRLLFGLGVGPIIVELDHHAAGSDIQAVLFHLASDAQHQPVPAVFVGGKFLGGIETLMACHINGTLVPLLKDAGALWL